MDQNRERWMGLSLDIKVVYSVDNVLANFHNPSYKNKKYKKQPFFHNFFCKSAKNDKTQKFDFDHKSQAHLS